MMGAWQLHCDTQPAVGARVEGEDSVVGPDDAVDDRQAQSGAVVVGARAFATALKRFDKCGNHWRGEPFARVLDGELH